jgi:hypothetical protein
MTDRKRFDWIVKAIDAEKLTDWEEGFLGDLERRVYSGEDLTDRQEEILERIFEDKQ